MYTLRMMRAARAGAAGIVVWALLSVAQTNAPQSGQSNQQTPVIRVSTRLVQVNVVVQDRHGAPVTGLTRDDFVLQDEGKEQTISRFTTESSQPLPAAVVSKAEALPPNTHTNRLESRGGVPTSVTVILLDAMNTPFSDQAYARKEIVKFLGQVQPQDRVAVYGLGRKLHIVHEFTRDVSSLLRAMDKYRGSLTPEMNAPTLGESGSGLPAFDAWMAETDAEIKSLYTRIQVSRTLSALEGIARHLAGIPGRKNLIWVSGSFPFAFGMEDAPGNAERRTTFSQEVMRTARVVNGADIAIYPLDSRGLVAPDPGWSAPRQPVPGPATRPTGATGRSRAAQSLNVGMPAGFSSSHDTMNDLAERTGGKAFYNTNDISGAVRRAIDDSRVTYVLGYYPAEVNWDGRYRRIKVRVKREGLSVRHRLGYYADADSMREERERMGALRAAAASPLDATMIRVTVRGEPSGRGSIALEVAVEPRDVVLERVGNLWLGGVDFLFVQRNAEGAALMNAGQRLNLRYTHQVYERVMRDGFSLAKTLRLNAETNDIRVIVRDVTSGTVGSVQVPILRAAESSKP